MPPPMPGLLGIEDVVISSGLSRPDFLDSCVAAFSLLPVAIHVGAGGLLSRFKDAARCPLWPGDDAVVDARAARSV